MKIMEGSLFAGGGKTQALRVLRSAALGYSKVNVRVPEGIGDELPDLRSKSDLV